MNLIDRVVAPTPAFFQKLRNIGLVLAAISAAIISAPISLPAMVVTVAGYLAVAGSVLGAVSQITVPGE
jgi:ABC-type xylose transport system permease subunit